MAGGNNASVSQADHDALVERLRQVEALLLASTANANSGNFNRQVKVIPDQICEPNSICLNPEQTEKTITVNLIKVLGVCKTKFLLQTGDQGSLHKFVQAFTVFLDTVSAAVFQDHIKNYDELAEKNADENLSTDFIDQDRWLEAKHFSKLFERFVRFVIEKMFTERLQNIVRLLYDRYVHKDNLTSISPSAIIKALEEFRLCSHGQQQALVIGRPQIYIDFVKIMKRASPRHQQTFSLCLQFITATYTDVEMVNKMVNPMAAASHATKLSRIGVHCDAQFNAIASTQSTALLSNVNNTSYYSINNTSLFNDQASEAIHGSDSLFISDDFEALLDVPKEESSINQLQASVDSLAEQVKQLSVVHNVGSSVEINEHLSEEELDDICAHNIECVAQTLEQNDPAMVFAMISRTPVRGASFKCFRCGEEGHRKAECPMNVRDDRERRFSSRFRSKPKFYTPGGSAGSNRSPNKPFKSFSSVFARKGGARRPWQSKFEKPRNKFRAFAKHRDSSGGKNIHTITTEHDVLDLPSDAEIFMVDMANMASWQNPQQPNYDDIWGFDWA